MQRGVKLALVVLAGATFCTENVRAQESGAGAQQPDTSAVPKPAATGGPLLPDQDLTDDNLPLSGAQSLTLGLPPSGHSFLLPSFGIATNVQTNPYNSGQLYSPSTTESTYLTGRLALSHNSGRSSLSLDYLAGGSFSSDSNQSASGIQSLSFSDRIGWGRWSVMFGDQLNYTSQSPFGFGGLGGLNNLGVGMGTGTKFQPGFVPDQSVLIDGSPQIANGTVAELDYALSHRSSLTFSGSYGMLRFVDGGLQDSSSVVGQAGYNYQVSRFDSIAIFYGFNELAFSGLSQKVENHSVQFSYARRITRRISLQASAGPVLEDYHSPIAGPSSVLSWTASAALMYARRSMGVGISYNHSLTGGSGVLTGATTDIVSGNLRHSIGKDWDGTIATGYSRNRALQQTTVNASAVAAQGWFATGQVNRHFIRYGSLYFSYNASGQTGVTAVCGLPVCQANSLTQTISVGYNWGLRPIPLE